MNKLFRRLSFSFSLVPCLIAVKLVGAHEPFTLAIMNFANRSQDPEWQWVSKGLADMLITDLSRTDKFQIVEREKMQRFLDEMGLSETGLIDPASAARFGEVAKVKKALFVSYLVERELITIEAHIIDIDTQQVQRVEWATGHTHEVLDLEKQLALNIVKNVDLQLTEEELKSLRYSGLAQYPHEYLSMAAWSSLSPAKNFALSLSGRAAVFSARDSAKA